MIVDDHPLFREGLRKIIAEIPDMAVVADASDGPEMLHKIRKQDVDVVLLDICMPGRDGLDALKQLKCEHPRVRVLILSMYSEREYALRALGAGAAGYLTKGSAPEQVIQALRTVASGKKYITPSVAQTLAHGFSEQGGRPRRTTKRALSDREYQVMRMIAAGKRLTDIAAELSLSVKTIETHRLRILEKMGMNSNAELIRYVVEQEIAERSPLASSSDPESQ